MLELLLIKTVVSGYGRKMKSGPKDTVEHLGKMEGKAKRRIKVRKAGLRLKLSSWSSCSFPDKNCKDFN
ncbi:hypothetical protein DSL64_12915 [Dyadobacter luteus]|uniref:Uncharacterized protein n=1 Tax=Dyadobacter luteus TaxID=2259619 RepID=A0A3D8YBE7_9BACT|nr:hypothetical protein DSL64_12915 [Dyadobacter luteus]